MTSEPFSFENYDCIGFDLDNTLVEYNILPMQNLIYDTLCRYLVSQKGHSKILTSTKIDLKFLQKGLFLDFSRGNVVKLDSVGKVVIAYHGTKQVEDLEAVYGNDGVWDIGKQYIDNPLEAWNGPLGERIRCLLDSFDMASGLVFARAIDSLPQSDDYYFVWADILAGLYYMYSPENFAGENGKFFPTIKNNPDTFIKKLPKETIQWIRNLRAKEGKYVFMLTGSADDFASFTASIALGEDWKELFDFVVFFAKKPAFFLEKRPFRDVATSEPFTLTDGVRYAAQGNWPELQEHMARCVKDRPKVVYIGDNLVQDVLAPVSSGCCDAVAIVSEDEGTSIWGSYFNGIGDTPSFWHSVLARYATHTIPSISSYLFCPRLV